MAPFLSADDCGANLLRLPNGLKLLTASLNSVLMNFPFGCSKSGLRLIPASLNSCGWQWNRNVRRYRRRLRRTLECCYLSMLHVRIRQRGYWKPRKVHRTKLECQFKIRMNVDKCTHKLLINCFIIVTLTTLRCIFIVVHQNVQF